MCVVCELNQSRAEQSVVASSASRAKNTGRRLGEPVASTGHREDADRLAANVKLVQEQRPTDLYGVLYGLVGVFGAAVKPSGFDCAVVANSDEDYTAFRVENATAVFLELLLRRTPFELDVLVSAGERSDAGRRRELPQMGLGFCEHDGDAAPGSPR